MTASRLGATVKVDWQTKELMKLTQRAVLAGLREAGKGARRGLKAELAAKGPSSPGSPPGRRSGTLHKAVGMRTKSKAGKFVALDVGVQRPSRYDGKFPGEQYAKALRLSRGFVGRDRRGRVYRQRPRPFVAPYVRRNQQRIASTVSDTASTWMPKAKEKT